MPITYNPRLIAMGDGVTCEWDMSTMMLKVMKDRALGTNVEKLKVVKASLGDEVEMVGAAAVAFNTQH